MRRALAASVVAVAALVASAPILRAQSPFDGLTFRSVGPAVMGGRIHDVEVDPADPSTIFLAAAGGGLWRTTNHGILWTPVFDETGENSFGDVAISPVDSKVIWAGTGEQNNRQSSTWGGGIYRSTDGGTTWRFAGLRETSSIARVLPHPRDPNVAWVAALGNLWRPTAERGVYKTTDAGVTWTKVLAVDSVTGAVELLMEIVGWDGRALEKEIEKLRLYLKPETKVTEQAVREIGAGRRELEVWDWCDAVVAGKIGPARAGLRRLLDQGESEVALAILLASSLRLAALGRVLQEARLLRLPPPGGYGQPTLDPAAESILPRNAKGEKANLWRLGKVTGICAHRPVAGVRRALNRLHELQIELVSGGDRVRALEEGILRLCLD